MMRKIIGILGVMLSGFAFAAQFQWSAYSGIDGAFADGSAYLIQGSEGVTVEQIASTLKTSGIPASTPDGYKMWSNSTVASDRGYTFVDNVSFETTETITANGWFVICFTDDMSKFTISQIESASSGDGGASWLLSFNGTMSDEYVWTTGTVAGSDPSVPEPTALALLALGVAGLALRRKVA